MGTETSLELRLSDLDLTYGPCLDAGDDIRAQERTMRPNSLMKLDGETAELLRRYIQLSTDGLLLIGTFNRVHPILWVLDNDGDIWFAIEEVFDIKSSQLSSILGAAPALDQSRYVKLGHPSLILSPSKRARIGGEILYRPTENVWLISNKSGRYGLRPHQTEEHLRAVASKFGGLGVELEVSFWPVREPK